jgi:hypothetical protein
LNVSRDAWAFVVGLALLVVGLVIVTAMPSSGGEVLVILGCLVLGGVAIVVMRTARRSPGWTRVVNPGAARREARAEREAAERRERELGHTEGDDQAS